MGMDGVLPHESYISTGRNLSRRLARGFDSQSNQQRPNCYIEQVTETLFTVRFYPRNPIGSSAPETANGQGDVWNTA
jgi:hypothetical protein